MVSSSIPRTPSTNNSPPGDKLLAAAAAAAAIPGNLKENHPPRRSSLGLLLRRSKSGELKPSKKQQAILREQEIERQRREAAAAIPKFPPRLPDLSYDSSSSSNNNNNNNNGGGQRQPTLPFCNEDRPDAVALAASPRHANGRASMEPPRSAAIAVSSEPVPPVPSASHGSRNGAWVDPYARTESMTHRGRYSYASSAVSSINSPRRVRRRKDPTPFNILIIGARSSGKTSFLDFLKTSLALPPQKRSNRPTPLAADIFAPYNNSSKTGGFNSHYLETEIDGERIGLTLWDSEGLEKSVVDLQLREMTSFLESKFEETFTEEMKVVRAPGVQDTHIHCAFLLLDPLRLDRNMAASRSAPANGTAHGQSATGRGLDEDLDLQVLRSLQGKTTVIPVISKADTITTAHMAYLKKTVWDSLRSANLDPLEALGLDEVEPDSPRDGHRIDEGDEDEDDTISSGNPAPASAGSLRRQSGGGSDPEEMPYLPLSIISPDSYEPGVIGRQFPWGCADPLNAEHCDFLRLKDAVFNEWRGELREASRDLWYEGWRTSRLKHREMRR
ncbi:hypothetical protein B2J93_6081 [Marssonina coronariae]|uniref:Septin-type G domain-containing protein n=1 Tax=Diplocarpon coronariae TaxID=2795749 RepID=A0A218Z6W4_9HELO|nr:hypothetical protein B2J93_6081 [Marssonina coronariae]